MYINMLEMHTIIIIIKTACLPMADISETLAELCPIGCLTLLGSPSQIPSRFPDLQIITPTPLLTFYMGNAMGFLSGIPCLQ